MEQFYQLPPNHSRKHIAVLFQSQTQTAIPKPNSEQFIPFSQERDKLGRLISRQNKERSHKNHQSLPSSVSIKLNKNMQDEDIKPKVFCHAALERMFKLNQVRQFKSSKNLEKIRILSTSSQQKIQPSLIGQYDIAAIADKIKFKKSTQIALKNVKLPAKAVQQSLSQANVQPTRKVAVKKQQGPLGTKISSKKLQVNYDLPELQKYHEMKKLKMKHYDNFEQNHLKFKELARFSLVLANQIKKGLELD